MLKLLTGSGGLQDASLGESRAVTRHSLLVALNSTLPTDFAHHRNKHNFQKSASLPEIILLVGYHSNTLSSQVHTPQRSDKASLLSVDGKLQTVGREGQQDRLGEE